MNKLYRNCLDRKMVVKDHNSPTRARLARPFLHQLHVAHKFTRKSAEICSISQTCFQTQFAPGFACLVMGERQAWRGTPPKNSGAFSQSSRCTSGDLRKVAKMPEFGTGSPGLKSWKLVVSKQT
jgi:hypothetical protein